MNRRTSKRPTRNAKRRTAWCSSILNNVEVEGTATIVLPIVEPNEWEQASLATFQKGGSLLAIRGWLSAMPFIDEGTNVDGTLFVSIWRLDIDDGAVNPVDVTRYVNEDVIWTAGTLGGPSTTEPIHWQLDIGSRRKLMSSQVVTMSLRSTAAGNHWLVSGLIRALVALP